MYYLQKSFLTQVCDPHFYLIQKSDWSNSTKNFDEKSRKLTLHIKLPSNLHRLSYLFKWLFSRSCRDRQKYKEIIPYSNMRPDWN